MWNGMYSETDFKSSFEKVNQKYKDRLV
jgi:hypothetical protein